MKRILLFVHYNKNNYLGDYIVYLLKEIRHLYSRIVFISNSFLNDKQKLRLNGLQDSLIIRENKGYDFGAWKDALLIEGWKDLSTYDSLTLMNDTCFGPFYDMEILYNKMEQKNIDFWGLTAHHVIDSDITGIKGNIPEHLQSYFICFNKRIITAEIFKAFWENVIYEEKIYLVIQNYEIKLTVLLKMSGYNYEAIFEMPKEIDFTLIYPDICINNSIPLVKIKSFLYFPYPEFLEQLIEINTKYPYSLISNHFNEQYEPGASFLISNKVFNAACYKSAKIVLPLAKIAIHLHVFYFDVFEKYIEIFDKLTIEFRIFVTTNTIEKKKTIEYYMQKHICIRNLEEIIVCKNHGRDIIPWLSIAEKLESFDIIGHFHTKKAPSEKDYVGYHWQLEIFDSLLVHANNIINIFNTNENIGIVIPDIPLHFQLNQNFLSMKMKSFMNEIWNKMGCNRKIDFSTKSVIIFPHGNMFWYRPAALRPLFKLKLEYEDIPEEPIAGFETILHCIERMLVYIAWSEGFDYRISQCDKSRISAFRNNLIIYNKISEYSNSRSYKIGKKILAIPKIIKNLISKPEKKLLQENDVSIFKE